MAPMATDVKPKAGLEDVVAGESAICYLDGDRGEYKAIDIRARYDLSAFARIHAYGDSREDRPMLALAHERWYRGRQLRSR